MSTWFTSDLHFGHRLVAGHRGFTDTTDHDDAICIEWCKRVTTSDQVWVLGDLTLSNPTKALGIIAELPGTKHFISGNHDPCHPMHRDSHKWQRRYLAAFESVQPFARRKIAGHYVLLSHFPYTADRGEVRYSQYRLADEGMWLLHGHLHSTEQRTSAREIHVGVDAWGLAPVNLDTIAEMLGQ